MGHSEGHSPAFEAELDRILIGPRQPGPVTLSEYDPEWPRRFGAVRGELSQALGSIARGIEHVGSTAVPGLAAKPIIDVLVTVESVEPEDPYAAPLIDLGYELRVREEGHRMFRPPARDVHIHVWASGSDQERDYLLLRDRLRTSAEYRNAYEQLKRELAERDWPDVNYYARAKGPFIRRLVAPR